MIENEELLYIVPHRGRMLLISRIKSYNLNERILEAEYDITEDCLFYNFSAAGVPAWAGIELIAQAISALAGLRGRENGEKPRIGFILSVLSLKIEFPFIQAGNTVAIKIRETDYIDSVHSFEGQIFLKERKILSGNLLVMDVDNEYVESLKKENAAIE